MIVADLAARLGLDINEAAWEKGDRLIEGLKRGLAVVGVALGIHELMEVVHGVAELADHATKASQKLGITAETIQELGYAAKLSDISQEELEISLGHLAKQIVAVKDGSQQATDAFKKLGISSTDQAVKAGDTGAVLAELADGFQKMPDGAQKTALAMEIFGRSGKSLIPFLNAGSAGIEDLRKEARELGIVVDTETAKKFEEFNDDQTRLSETWRGLRTQVVTALLPALQELVSNLIEWVKAHQDVIKSSLKTMIDAMVVAIKGFMVLVEGAAEILDFFSENSTAAAIALGVLGAALVAFGVQAAYAWVLALGPLELVILAIAALTAGVILLIKHWDKVKAKVSDAIQYMKEKVSDFGNYIASLPGKLLDALVGFAEGIKAAFVEAFEQIKAKAEETWDKIRNAPVIKQIIDVGERILDPSGIAEAAEAAQNVAKEAIIDPGYAGTAVTFGDTNVSVTAAPGTTPEQLQGLVNQQVTSHWQGKIQEAFDATRGGRR